MVVPRSSVRDRILQIADNPQMKYMAKRAIYAFFIGISVLNLVYYTHRGVRHEIDYRNARELAKTDKVVEKFLQDFSHQDSDLLKRLFIR